MRSISFALTERQFLDGTKTVTRRVGWHTLKPGTLLRAVRKCQGLKKGEKQNVLGIIRVVSARQERLWAINTCDVRREGFPGMSSDEFITFFGQTHKGANQNTMVTRIEFEKVTECKP